jgi:hypothetical protein
MPQNCFAVADLAAPIVKCYCYSIDSCKITSVLSTIEKYTMTFALLYNNFIKPILFGSAALLS